MREELDVMVAKRLTGALRWVLTRATTGRYRTDDMRGFRDSRVPAEDVASETDGQFRPNALLGQARPGACRR